jgi:ribosomal protein S18 acetylase RimI-like enzyme
MEIVEVRDNKNLRRFINFPKELYKNDDFWVPPLWGEEARLYLKKHNPILAHSDFTLHLALENNQVVGRNLVYIDHNFNDYYKSALGFFGSFECRNNIDTAKALVSEAEAWLKARGIKSVRGPIHPMAEMWGFLYDNFSATPVFMAPYNPSYYNELIVNCGYQKVKDLLAYEANARTDYKIPERFVLFAQRLLAKRSNISLRRLNLKNLMADAEHIWRISNIAIANNWGYVPLNREELQDMVKKMKVIVDVDAVWFVEDKGVPVGYCLGIPDLNVAIKKIKGRLFPLGVFTILGAKKRIRDYRLFGLAVLPQYHNLGLDVLLYVNLYNYLSPKKIRLEANYILEDNMKIRVALEKLKLKLIKTYRIYEKQI